MKTIALLAAAASIGQPVDQTPRPAQEVVVTGREERSSLPAAQAFVSDITAPVGETLSRMHKPVCPVVMGFQPAATKILVERMRETAIGVGATPGKANCDGNVILIVADDPNALLDDIRRRKPGWLASLQPTDIRALKKAPSKVRAWTIQVRRDRDGIRERSLHREGSATNTDGSAIPPIFMVQSSSIIRQSSRIDVDAAFIVVPREETRAATLSQVADYAIMRALTQTREPTRSAMSTILTLYSQGARETPVEMTRNDIAYLQALYRVNTLAATVHAKAEISRRLAGE